MSEPTFAVRASHEELLARLSLEEKITLLTGADRLSVGRSSHDLPVTVTVTIGKAPGNRSATC